MTDRFPLFPVAIALLIASVGPRAAEATARDRSASPAGVPAPNHAASAPAPSLDLSGRKRVGKASVYARKFAGRRMADGAPMNPKHNNAASKTLPLGTTAKVTNVETGQSAVVTIQDRGPYVGGRIVDLSPATADQVGITPQKGIATVEVVPITVPLPDGGVKPGEAARDTTAGAFASGDRRR